MLIRLTLLIARGLPAHGAGDWTQFRLNANNNAVVPGTLSVSWRVITTGAFSSSPSVSGTMVFVGNNAGELYAVDARSGRTIWTARVANPLMSAPLVYDDLVIVGEGNEVSPAGSSPSHPIRVGTPPNALLAFNRISGALVWRRNLTGSGMPMPAILGNRLLHHNGAGVLLALDPRTGAVMYRRDLRSIASMSAIVPVSSASFITQGVDPNAVFAVRAADGSVIWRALFSAISSGIGDCPAAAQGSRVYCDYVMPPSFATPVQTERQATFRAFALDVKTGRKIWDVELDRGVLPKRNEAAIPLAVDRTVFVGSSLRSAIHAIDAATGRGRWTINTHGPVKGGIVDVSGTLYFGDLAGYLWAVRDATGAVIGVRNAHASFNVGSPIVVGQTLIIGSRGGTLMAIPLARIRSARDR